MIRPRGCWRWMNGARAQRETFRGKMSTVARGVVLILFMEDVPQLSGNSDKMNAWIVTPSIELFLVIRICSKFKF